MASYFNDTPFAPSLAFTPYNLDNNSILNTINAKTNQFLNSALNIKNSYDNTFDFDLSNQSNILSLQSKQAEVDKQLKGTLKGDLSIGDISQKSLDLFKSVATDKNYLYDEHITKTIKSSLNEAEENLKKNGADNYNSLSVQSMQNTLNKWRNDSPDNYVSYLDDTLGTTYQPYDAKVDQAYLKNLQSKVKDGKIKVEKKDGSGNIISSTYSDMSSLEAQEYIRSTRPQQMATQEALEARVALDNLSEMNQTPEGRAKVQKYYEDVKNSNKDTEIGYMSVGRENIAAQLALTPDIDKDTKDALKIKLDEYDTAIKDVEQKYNSFDSDAYVNPNKIKQARLQVQSLNQERNINGIVSGLGLNQTAVTIKQDAAFFSKKNLDLAERRFAWQQLYDQAKLTKAGKSSDATSIPLNSDNSNSLAYDTPLISNPNDLSTPEGILKVGSEVELKLKGETESLKNQSYKNTLSSLQLNVRNANGYGSSDLLTAIDEAAKNGSNGLSMFKDIFSQFRDETSQKLVKALLNQGAIEEQGGIPANFDKIANIQASRWLKRALGNPETLKKALVKAGLDNQSFGAGDQQKSSMEIASDIYFDNQKAEMLKESNLKNYLPLYQSTARELGIKDFDNLKDDSPFFYEGDNFVYKRKGELKAKGYSDKEVDSIADYVKDGDVDKLLSSSPRLGSSNTQVLNMDKEGFGKFGVITTSKPVLNDFGKVAVELKDTWDNFDKSLKTKLANKGSDFHNKAVIYNLYDTHNKNDKNFSPSEDFKDINLQTVIERLKVDDSIISNIDGSTTNKNFSKALSAIVSKGFVSNEFIQGVKVETDGNKSWLTIQPKALTDESKKKFDGTISFGGIAGLFDYDKEDFFKDLGNVKIAIPNQIANQDFHLPTLSPAAGQLKAGQLFGVPKLVSGNSIQIEDRGAGENIQLYFNGKFKSILPFEGGKYRIKDIDFTTGNLDEIRMYTGIGRDIPGLLDQFKRDPEGMSKHINHFDMTATLIENVLKKYSTKDNPINPEEFVFSTLDPKIKEELKRTAPEVFGK